MASLPGDSSGAGAGTRNGSNSRRSHRSVSDPATFIKGFPVRYLRTHTPAEIEAHLALWELSRPTGAAVQLDSLGGFHRATIVARDMPALFASLAGAISSFGMDIFKAEAFSNAKGPGSGHLRVRRSQAYAGSERARRESVCEESAGTGGARQVGCRSSCCGAVLYRRNPSRAAIRSSVHFDSDACETATLVEIVAEDRPGLLYDLAATFSAAGCNIDVVLIDTEGRRAIDVFYVASDGMKLDAAMQGILEKKILAVC